MRKLPLKKGLFVLSIPLILYLGYKILLGVILIFYFVFGYINITGTRTHILYETDHQRLLNACRNLLDQGYYGHYDFTSKMDVNGPNIPPEVLELKPSYVVIDRSGVLKMEMTGGFSHLGVFAYRNDSNDPNVRYGNKKLLDGLWYYDDGYEGNTNFDKYIESLRPKKK